MSPPTEPAPAPPPRTAHPVPSTVCVQFASFSEWFPIDAATTARGVIESALYRFHLAGRCTAADFRLCRHLDRGDMVAVPPDAPLATTTEPGETLYLLPTDVPI